MSRYRLATPRGEAAVLNIVADNNIAAVVFLEKRKIINETNV